MKNPWEWDENDLLQLVNTGAQESVDLEFKASGALQNTDKNRDEISKDVSAFANSAGGTLIYGMVENRSTHVADSLDTGSDPNVTTREWLEQVINSKIQRRIDGVRIGQVALSITSPGKVAYVVYVPSSTRAPHQAADKKFYKRYNFQVLAMEEYEIRDVSRRGEVPDLRIDFSLPKTGLMLIPGTTEFEPFPLKTSIINDGFEPANYALITLCIDARLEVITSQGLGVSIERNAKIEINDWQFPVTLIQVTWGIPGKLPIFHAPYVLINSLLLKTDTDGRLGSPKYYLVGYSIQSPRMPVKEAYSLLEVRSGYIWLSATQLTEEEVSANYQKLSK